ncbi:MAG: RluA family pseudouridine synthase [Hyphomicrobiales bacterium]
MTATPNRDIRAFETSQDDSGDRLDRVLARHLPELSRSRLKALIGEGQVRQGARTVVDPNMRVKPGQRFEVNVPPPLPAEPGAEDIPLAVVHEDEHLVVIDKPADLVVHPGAGNWSGTLVNALIAHCGESLSGIGGVRRPGIVHRLDKGTTGLLVVAKTDAAHKGLAEQFADHGREGDLERCYLALVWGLPRPRAGTVETRLGRDPRNRKRMAVLAQGGKHAITHYETLRSFGAPGDPIASLVECRLETGRTHQIRVHMARLGNPVLGDDLYGAGFRTRAARLPEAAREALGGLRRQALHAATLGFRHPATGEFREFSAGLPADMSHLLDALQECAI